MSGATDAPMTPLPTAAPAATPPPVGATPPTIAAPAPTVEAPPPTVAGTPPTVAPAAASPTAVSPPASPEKKCDQQSGAADGKCSKECSAGDGTCSQESCKCDASCKCTSKNEGPSKSGKPEDCQSSNPVDCSDGTCKLTKTADPTNVGLVTNGKCLGPALYESPEEPHCKEGNKGQECIEKSECDQKRAECEKGKESDRERCPLSGDCDGSKQDSSLVVWHPNQGSPGGSPRSQTAGDNSVLELHSLSCQSLSRGLGKPLLRKSRHLACNVAMPSC